MIKEIEYKLLQTKPQVQHLKKMFKYFEEETRYIEDQLDKVIDEMRILIQVHKKRHTEVSGAVSNIVQATNQFALAKPIKAWD